MNRYTGLPPLPDRLNRLDELAADLWWSWNRDARNVFRQLDYTLWRTTAHNPVRLLWIIPREKLEAAADNPDVMIPFASIDPARGQAGARQARRLVTEFGVRGFKFHPNVQAFYPHDKIAYPLYAAIEELGVPVVFHTGQTGIGARASGGGGIGGFGGPGGAGGGGSSDDASRITSWVESHFTAETVGGVTVYNLTSAR